MKLNQIDSMKDIFKKIIIFLMTLEAKIVLLRFKPKIIAITGSVGKTSTKDAIFSALSSSLHIRKNQKSFNSEIGVPLTILGLDNGYRDIFKWLKNLLEGLLIPFKREYPDWLVLELGVDRPGDMEYMTKWLKVDIAVFTTFPNVPVHVEYFSSPQEVISEKKKLLNAVKPEGFVILNADDPEVISIRESVKRKVMTFGIEKDADLKITNEEILYKEEKPTGINFKVDYKNNSVPMKLNGVLGRQHVYPITAALCCGLSLGITKIEMADSLSEHKSAPGRMSLIDGINGSVIIDDTYNASPISVQEAVKTLASLETKGSKIAVLGDMSEIGRYTANEHKRIGIMVSELKIDYLFTLGKRSEFIKEQALEMGMKADKVFSFNEQGELSKKLKEYCLEGSVVLVKGSQVMRMEKIVKQIMREPEKAVELLVRQDNFWTS
jgi:UDP-N-acetylmuramoyl-tripeptide--D-alanyl-D-alanine ligase